MKALPGLEMGPSMVGVGTSARAVAAHTSATTSRRGCSMVMWGGYRASSRSTSAIASPLDRTPHPGVEWCMPYAEGRRFYDADSHLMETPEWLPAYADPSFRDRIRPFSLGSTGTQRHVEAMIARGRQRAGDPAERPGYEREL